MKVIVLGANSQISKDFILQLSLRSEMTCHLFSRLPESLLLWAKENNLDERRLSFSAYSQFSIDNRADVLINFVGVGDPETAKKMGSSIIDITSFYDQLALDYIKTNKTTKYIFLSSGAAYGGEFHDPVNSETPAVFNVSNLSASDWYGVSKFYAEARHRSMKEYSIFDVRVFNYYSSTMPLSTKSLITFVANSIISGDVLLTSADNINRDFITPPDFYELIMSIVNYPNHKNSAVDCYTKSFSDKFTLFEEIKKYHDFKYTIDSKFIALNATGNKKNYYSLNNSAKSIGYKPSLTSNQGVLQELTKLLSGCPRKS
jgi:nucleoside-diphosphate-sugar epimerase